MSKQKTLRTWGYGYRCNECCNGDRCDEPNHYERSKCPHCKGTGNAIWKFTEMRTDLAEAVAALRRLSEGMKRIAESMPDAVRYMPGLKWMPAEADAILDKHK